MALDLELDELGLLGELADLVRRFFSCIFRMRRLDNIIDKAESVG